MPKNHRIEAQIATIPVARLIDRLVIFYALAAVAHALLAILRR